MELLICPGCKQNAPTTDARCPRCGFDLTGGPDVVTNRLIRSVAALAAVGAIAAVWWLNRRAGASPMVVYDLALLGVAAGLTAACRLGTSVFVRDGLSRWSVALILALPLATFGHARMLAAMRAYQAAPQLYASLYPDRPAPTAALTLLGMSRDGSPVVASAGAAAALVAPQPVVRELPSRSTAMVPLIRLTRDLFDLLAQQATDLRKEFYGPARLREMTAPGELADGRRVAAARARLQRLVARLDLADSEIRKRIGQFPSKMASANVPVGPRETFQAALRPAAGAPLKGWATFVAQERAILKQTDAILALAQSAGGRVTLKGGQLVFARADERTKYEQLARDLRDATAKQDAHVPRLRDMADGAIDQIETTLDTPPAAPRTMLANTTP